MSIMIDLPPQMAAEVREYVTSDESTLSTLVVNFLKDQISRSRAGKNLALSRFVGCIADGRRTDDVLSELRGYGQW